MFKQEDLFNANIVHYFNKEGINIGHILGLNLDEWHCVPSNGKEAIFSTQDIAEKYLTGQLNKQVSKACIESNQKQLF